MKKFGIILITAGCILFALAVALLLFNTGKEKAAAKYSADVLSAIYENAEEPSLAEEEKYMLSDEMPTFTYLDTEYIGVLTIPSIGIELPVSSEWSAAQLDRTLCRYSGSINKNNLVICGHNFTNQFAELDRLTEGDEVIFTDAINVTHRYTVSAVEVIDGTDIKGMTESDFPLTLYTCNFTGKMRIAVRCEKEK